MINFENSFKFDIPGNVQYIKYNPHNLLKEFIDCYWVLHTDNQHLEVPLYADATTEIFINMGGHKANINKYMTIDPGNMYIGGPSTSVHFFNCFPGNVFIGIRFKPGGLPAFYNLPLSEVVDQITEFEDRQFLRLIDLDNFLAIRLDEYFLSRKRAILPITAIKNIVHNAKGRISVDLLAKCCNVSNRTLERHFYAYMGIGPKDFINIVRFQQTVLALEKGHLRGDLAKMAVEMGYYDQSHFIKEVKKRGGALPSAIGTIPNFV